MTWRMKFIKYPSDSLSLRLPVAKMYVVSRQLIPPTKTRNLFPRVENWNQSFNNGNRLIPNLDCPIPTI